MSKLIAILVVANELKTTGKGWFATCLCIVQICLLHRRVYVRTN